MSNVHIRRYQSIAGAVIIFVNSCRIALVAHLLHTKTGENQLYRMITVSIEEAATAGKF